MQSLSVFADNLYFFYKTTREVITKAIEPLINNFVVINDDEVENLSCENILKNIRNNKVILAIYEIRAKVTNSNFINNDDLEFLKICYDEIDNIVEILEPLSLNFENEYNDLLQYQINLKEYQDDFIIAQNKIKELEKSYLSFLEWACKRELLIFPYDTYYYIESYQSANNDSQQLVKYLDSNLLQEYTYNLALHLIIVNPNIDNELFKKYNINLGAVGFSNSISDSTSSVGLTIPNFLNDLSPSDSLLSQTPYGLRVLEIKSYFNNLISVV